MAPIEHFVNLGSHNHRQVMGTARSITSYTRNGQHDDGRDSSKISKLNNILLRQNISNLDCDMQVCIHYTKLRRNVLWTQKHGLSS